MPRSASKTRFAHLHRLPQMMLFAALVAWSYVAGAVAVSAANGLGFRLRLVYGRGLLEASFQLFLLMVGFLGLQGVARQGAPLEEVTALPRRATAGREWLTGVALGWAIVVAAVLPIVLLARIHAQVAFGAAEVRGALLAVGTAAVATLAHEMTFRGYPFRCLIRAVGPSFATVLMVGAAGVLAWHHVGISGTGILASMLLTLLLSLSWLRTHAIWLAWGVHFSLVASAALLFGLPIERSAVVSTLVRSRVYGPGWLTGGEAGPIGTVFALLVLVGAIWALYRLTRDYAWSYTHVPIVSAGAPVSVAPPAAHTAMEQQTTPAPALVQILATTPKTFSVAPAHVVPPAAERMP